MESKIENKLNFKQHFLNNFLCLKAYRQPNICQRPMALLRSSLLRFTSAVRAISVGELFLEKYALRPFHEIRKRQEFTQRMHGMEAAHGSQNSPENTT